MGWKKGIAEICGKDRDVTGRSVAGGMIKGVKVLMIGSNPIRGFGRKPAVEFVTIVTPKNLNRK